MISWAFGLMITRYSGRQEGDSMNDVDVLVAKMQTLILEWAETQNSKSVVPDIAQAILATLEHFPFVGSVVEQEFYERHRAEILGGRLFEGSL
jgi:hypothetical protein